MNFNEDSKKTPSKKMTSSDRPLPCIFGTALAAGEVGGIGYGLSLYGVLAHRHTLLWHMLYRFSSHL